MNNQSVNNSVYETTINLFLITLIIAWCGLIMYPFVNIILWSLILGMALTPIHGTLSKKLGGKHKLASALLVIAILIIVIVPVGWMAYSLFGEIKELKASYENGTLTIPPPTDKVKGLPVIGEKLYTSWQSASQDLEQFIAKNKEQLQTYGAKVIKGIKSAAGGVFQIIVALVIAGILLSVGGLGNAIRKFFRKVGGDRGDEFTDLTFKTVLSVVKGVVAEAVIIALLHGLVFMLAGVPYAGVWTLVVMIVAMLQLPVYIVSVPIMVYFFAVNTATTAIIWSVLLLLASLSDNILTPLLLGKGAPVPMVVIFIGAIGGFILSGFIGLFTGAIVISLGYKLFLEWVHSQDAV